MNKLIKVVFLVSTISLASCNSNIPSSTSNTQLESSNSISSSDSSNSEQTNNTSSSEQSNTSANLDGIVIYFSCTNNTEKIATYISEIESIELKEIVPTDPYTSEDLNYNNSSCRANQEQNDDSARPAYQAFDININNYYYVFLGYPIWWGKLPKIIYTFLEDYDFSNKTIIPFCTSGGSSINTSVNEIKSLEPQANVLGGRRFSSSSSKNDVSTWIDTLNI